MKEKRQQYSREFKLEAVRLLEESEKPLARVARDLGIHPSMLRRWKDQVESGAPNGVRRGPAARDVFPGNGKLSTGEEEIRRFRRELELVRQERDFLKKAAAYFAKESR